MYKMVTSDYGVWVSFRSLVPSLCTTSAVSTSCRSSVLSLYDARRHVKLLQVDYTSVLPSTVPFLDEVSELAEDRVITILLS